MDSYEVTGGLQNTFCKSATIGIAGSYEHNFIRYQHGGSGKLNTGFIGLYGLYRPTGFYLLADAAYGYSYTRTKRSIHAGSLYGKPATFISDEEDLSGEAAAGRIPDKIMKVTGKPKLSQSTFYGEIGIDCDFCGFLLQPFAAIQTGNGSRTHVKESSGKSLNPDLALAIKKHQWTSTSTRLGIHLTAVNLYQCIDASLDLAWNRRLGKRKNCTVGRFVEFGNEFGITGIPLDSNGIDYALTLSSCLCDCVRTFLEISGETWRHASTYDILAGVELSW